MSKFLIGIIIIFQINALNSSQVLTIFASDYEEIHILFYNFLYYSVDIYFINNKVGT